MKVVITGGLGFLGLRLARALLGKGTLAGASGGQEEIERIVLFDAVAAGAHPAGRDERVETVAGDIADGALAICCGACTGGWRASWRSCAPRWRTC